MRFPPARRAAALVLAALATIVTSAVAARFTTRYNALEAELLQRSAALSGMTDKDSVKEKKLFDGAIKKLGKTTTTLKAEISLGKSVAAPLRKKLDPTDAILTALSAAADGLEGLVQTRIDAVQLLVPKVTPEKVQKQIDAAKASLAQSDTETDLVKRYVRIGQAESKVTKAEKLATKIDTGGGGGGKAFVAGESASMDEDGSPIVFDSFRFQQITPLPDGANQEAIVLTLLRKAPNARELAITLHDPSVRIIDVAVFAGSLSGDASAFYRQNNDQFGVSAGDGTIEITEYDSAAGKITFNFAIDASPLGDLTNGTVTITNFRR